MEYIPLFFGAKFAYDLLMIELILDTNLWEEVWNVKES